MQQIKRAWAWLRAHLGHNPHDDSHLYGWRKYEDGLLGRVVAIIIMALLIIGVARLLLALLFWLA